MLADTITDISGDRLPLILDVMRSVSSSLDLATLLPTIMARTTELVRADRSTFFVVDRERGEIWSRVAQGLGAAEIRVPIGVGIAGLVAQTGDIVNIPDAYADSRFNPDVDRRTGYHTRNILCVPVRNPDGEIVGVLQAINRHAGPFEATDEALMLALAAQIDVALRNTRLVEEVRRQSQLNRVLLEVMRAVSAELEIDNLLPLIVAKTTEVMDADRSTIFLVDERRGQIWSRVAQGLGGGMAEIRVPIGAGIAGHVALSGEIVNIPDAYADARFNPEVDRRTGYHTRNILCMPIRNDTGKIIGVAQVLNKNGGPFTGEDESLLDALTSQISVTLENAQLFEETVYLKNYNESVLNSMATGVISVDAEGAITTVNPAGLRIFRLAGDTGGRSLADVLASPTRQREIAEMPEAVRATLQNQTLVDGLKNTLTSGDPYHAQDAKVCIGPDDLVNINVSAHSLRDSKGATIGAVMVVQDITDEQRLMSTLYRYVSREIADALLQDKDKLKLGGTRQEVTILCADIRDFTTISEQYTAEEIVELLNEYFKYMIAAIQANGGTIDKFIGDAILAVFGAPMPATNHALHAARASIAMRRALAEFNRQQARRGKIQVQNGIGLSAGEVLVGNIGADQRMDYTVIGDAVNVAARLEGLSKGYTAKVIIAGPVWDRIRHEIDCVELGEELVKGRLEAVRLFGILDDAANA